MENEVLDGRVLGMLLASVQGESCELPAGALLARDGLVKLRVLFFSCVLRGSNVIIFLWWDIRVLESLLLLSHMIVILHKASYKRAW